MEIRDEKLSSEHPMSGAVHENLAMVQGVTGYYKDALAHSQKAAQIKEKAGEEYEYDAANSYCNSARIQSQLNDFDGVIFYLLSSFKSLFCGLNCLVQAQESLKRAISIYEKQLDPDDCQLIRAKNDLVRLLLLLMILFEK